MKESQTPGGGLEALRRFTRSRAQAAPEVCVLCSAALGPDHPHLLERANRRIACSCQACALLFAGQPDGRYLRIPHRVRLLHDFRFDDGEWEQMMLPIGLAFFVRKADGSLAAIYPSPAGAVESLLALDGCAARFASQPELAAMEPEVEALLVHRIAADPLSFLVPIDDCFRLVGVMRQNWRGLSGGPSLWGAVARFFDELRQRADNPVHVRYA
jgi:hypothetical protein